MAAVRSAQLFEIYGLGCGRPPEKGGALFDDCQGRCEHKAGEYLGHEYKRCPIREALDDRQLVQARLYRNQLALGMTTEEPVGWLSQLVLELEREDSMYRAEQRSR